MPKLLVLLSLFIMPVVSAAELLMSDCNTTAGWGVNGGGVIAATSRSGDPAIKVSWAAGASAPIVFRDNGAPYVPVNSTQTYDGIRFWVKGDGSTNWGNIALWYDTTSYYRAYAIFPITTTWTEVTIPWREFYQRTFVGRLENRYKDVFGMIFTSASFQFAGHPLQPLPAMSYEVDNIRMVSDITLPSTPIPTYTGIDKTLAKLNAKQPVKIVVVGASIAYGVRCQNPATDCWPYKLQEALKTQFGYSNITVVDQAIGGFSSHHGACTLGWFCFEQEPIDLMISCDFFVNDAGNIPGTVTRDFADAEIAHNYENFFGYVLRRNKFEVMNVHEGLIVASGSTNSMDTTNAAVKDVCQRMHIYTADIYGQFQALGYNYLLTNYYTYDSVHFNEVAHTAAAQIVLNAIVAAANKPPVFSSAATAIPQTVTAGTPIAFSAAATDPNGDALTYWWAFAGDTADGASVTHTYTVPGWYTATVFASDSRGGIAISDVTVVILPNGGGETVDDLTDTDGDGVSDANELAYRTDPLDPKSFVKLEMTVSKFQGAVKFGVPAKDSCSINGIVTAVPAKLSPPKTLFIVNVAGAITTFTLDPKGRGANANGSVVLKLKGTRNKTTKLVEFNGGEVPFMLRLKNGDWNTLWSDEGVSDITIKGAPLSMIVDIAFAGRVYTATIPTTYSARQGVGGKFKK